MKKGQTYEGIVSEMKFPNIGIVEIQEEDRLYRVSVKNALPGQTVSFRIHKVRSKEAEGRLLGVVKPAVCETADRCIYAGECGGCLYQGFPYEMQLAMKQQQVEALLEKYTKGAVCDGILPSPEINGYRNKMEFTFGNAEKDGPLTLGLHKRGSMYDILSVDSCRIMDADYRKILMYTQEYFRGTGYSFFHKVTHTGYLRHLLVRKAVKTGEILVALVTTTQETHNLVPWMEGLRALATDGTFAGILHLENDSLADVVRAEQVNILYGRDYFMEELLGLKFRISTFSFFQTNSRGAEVLYSLVREYVSGKEKGATVFDLYSGTGTIAQMLAPAAKKVIGVEIVEDAVVQARENAAMNGLKNCEFLASDVLKALDEITDKPDYIILDPPRDGVHPKALSRIIAYGVEQMVYIACKPTSLARDLEMLTGRGYKIVRYGMVDMFPATANVETVVLLSQTS